MANVPRVDTTGITNSEGLIGQLYNYISSLPNQYNTPQVDPNSAGLPGYGGLSAMLGSLRKAPMTAMPGGGVSDPHADPRYQSALRLEGNPARAQIGANRAAAEQGIMGQNLQIGQADLGNNMALMEMLNSLLGGSANFLSQLGSLPPTLRGQSMQTAANGTGAGGGGFLGMLGL